MPQPNLVPVRPITSRSTHSSGIAGGTSTAWVSLFTSSEIMGTPLPTLPDMNSARLKPFGDLFYRRVVIHTASQVAPLSNPHEIAPGRRDPEHPLDASGSKKALLF